MNFACGVTFDPTLVLTHWILTLAIQWLKTYLQYKNILLEVLCPGKDSCTFASMEE